MKYDLYSLIRYIRLKEGNVKLQYLAKKIGISNSYLSLMERGARPFMLNDFEKALSCLGCNIKIFKDGKDCVEEMKKDILLKDGFEMTDAGYCKDYKDVNGNAIRVEFCTFFDSFVLVERDFKNESKYLSNEKYKEYEEMYSDEDGYGEFYEKYIDGDKYLEIVMKSNNREDIVVEDIAYTLFDKNTIEEIKNVFNSLID